MNTDILRGTLRAGAAISAKLRYVDHVGGADTPIYDGAYTVIPELTPQSLPTAGKALVSDITVEQIPIDTVTNAAGGNTIIIG